MIKVLYIAGYGRSGSTLLSILLDNVPGVANLGEVAGLPRYLGVPGLGCSCNRQYTDCPVWGEVINRLPGGVDFVRELDRYQREIEPWNAQWSGDSGRSAMVGYRKRMSMFFDVASQVMGARVLVDSSKTAYASTWRALALGQVQSIDVFVVHLIRDLEGVVASCKKGRDTSMSLGGSERSKIYSSIAGFVGWSFSNISANVIKSTLTNEKHILVRYENIVKKPERNVNNIIEKSCNKVGENESKLAFENRSSIEVGHMIGGNRVGRNNKKIRIEKRESVSRNTNFIESRLTDLVETIYEKLVE